MELPDRVATVPQRVKDLATRYGEHIIAAFVFWLQATAFWVSVAALGAGTAPLRPLATARAHEAMPCEVAMVQAISGLFAPLGIALPLLVGLIADQFGLAWALLVMLLQPIVLLALALRPENPIPRPAA